MIDNYFSWNPELSTSMAAQADLHATPTQPPPQLVPHMGGALDIPVFSGTPAPALMHAVADTFPEGTPCFSDATASYALSQVEVPGCLAAALGAAVGSGASAVAMVTRGGLRAHGVELAAAARQNIGLAVLVLRGPEPGSQASPEAVAGACGAGYRLASPGALQEDLRWATQLTTKGKPAVLEFTAEAAIASLAPHPETEGVQTLLALAQSHPMCQMFSAEGTEGPQALPDPGCATLAAEGYIRSTGEPACMVVSASAAVNTLQGLVAASKTGSALVVMVAGECDGLSISGHTICKDVHSCQGEVLGALQAALAAAQAEPSGPIVLEVLPAGLANPGGAPPPPELQLEMPPTRDKVLERVASALKAARQPLLVVGDGARGCQQGVVALAEQLGMAVVSTVSAKGAFPESHPLWLWAGLGRTMPPAMREIAETCDVALVLGACLGEVDTGDYSASLPAKCFHVHANHFIPGPASLPPPRVCLLGLCLWAPVGLWCCRRLLCAQGLPACA